MGSVKLYIEEYKILRKSSWLQPLSCQSINKKSRAAFAMRRPGVRSPLCSTNRIKYLRQGSDLVFFICHRFVTCRNGFHQVFKCSALRLIGSVRVAQSHSNIRPSEDRGKCESIRSAVSHTRGCRMTQVMKAEIFDSCIALRQIKSTLHVDQTSFRFWTWKDIFACPR